MPYTLLSAVAGWWGFPFGLIFTPISIIQNLAGGKDVTGHFRAALSGPPAPGPPAPGRSVVVPWPDGGSTRAPSSMPAVAKSTSGSRTDTKSGCPSIGYARTDAPRAVRASEAGAPEPSTAGPTGPR
jgi:hypothetical protein